MSLFKPRCGLILASLVVLGCKSTIGPADGAMDRSREIARLEAQNRLLAARLVALEATRPTEPTEAVVDASNPLLPRPAELSIATGSAIRGGVTPSATIRLSIVDRHGRFVQVTGPLQIVLATINDHGEAIRLAQIDVAPESLSAALRTGFMGTAYAIGVPLADGVDLPAVGGNVLVKATLHDVRLIDPLKVEQLVPVLPPRLSSGRPE